jgi:hypothetical protein
MTGSLNIAELKRISNKHFSGIFFPEWIFRFVSALVTAFAALALACYVNPLEKVEAWAMFLLTLSAYLHLSLGIHLLRQNKPAARFLYSGILICIFTATCIKRFSFDLELIGLILALIFVLFYLFPSGKDFRGLRYSPWTKPLSITLAWLSSLVYVSGFLNVWRIFPSLLSLILALALAADLAHFQKDKTEGVLTFPGRIGRLQTAIICGILCLTSVIVFPNIQAHPEWIFSLSFLFLLIMIKTLSAKDSPFLSILMDATLWLPFLFS